MKSGMVHATDATDTTDDTDDTKATGGGYQMSVDQRRSKMYVEKGTRTMNTMTETQQNQQQQ